MNQYLKLFVRICRKLDVFVLNSSIQLDLVEKNPLDILMIIIIINLHFLFSTIFHVWCIYCRVNLNSSCISPSISFSFSNFHRFNVIVTTFNVITIARTTLIYNSICSLFHLQFFVCFFLYSSIQRRHSYDSQYSQNIPNNIFCKNNNFEYLHIINLFIKNKLYIYILLVFNSISADGFAMNYIHKKSTIFFYIFHWMISIDQIARKKKTLFFAVR